MRIEFGQWPTSLRCLHSQGAGLPYLFGVSYVRLYIESVFSLLTAMRKNLFWIIAESGAKGTNSRCASEAIQRLYSSSGKNSAIEATDPPNFSSPSLTCT